jgi:hypothetical protein
MMARNVNLFVRNWQWTGSNVQTPQATADVELYWTANDGSAQTWSGTVTFPNDLQLVPVDWVKEELMDLILRAARKRLGIDD